MYADQLLNIFFTLLFATVSYLFDLITFPMYLIVQQPWEKKRLSKRPKAEMKYLDDNSLLITPLVQHRKMHVEYLAANVDTMVKMLNFVTALYGDRNCLGTREVLAEEDETNFDGRISKKMILGDYKWQSYNSVNRAAKDFGYGLRVVGVKPKDLVVIFAETRADWTIAAHGCFKQNFTIVTVYATIGEKGLLHGLSETEANVVITSHYLYPKIEAAVYQSPKVRCVIYMEDQIKKTNISGMKSGVKVYSFREIIEKGKDHVEDAQSPTKEDVALIMYTSGSTGIPKGVFLTHYNMVATIGSYSDVGAVKHYDVILSLLPLAHVYELLIEGFYMLYGTSIGYSSPLTVTDLSSKIRKGCKGDATVLRPQCMPAVPLILERFSKAINEKVEKSRPIKKALFKFGCYYKKKWTQRGFSTPILDLLVFSSTRKLLGGRLRVIMAGGAPCSPETHNFMKMCLCCNIQQGYGLTETTGGGAAMDEWDRTLGRIGGPVSSCVIRLIDWDEGNYRVKDKPFSRGEILISGQNVSIGYYKNATVTKESFFYQYDRRWFKTGDIAECHPDGGLKIIDRKKDLIKLQMGEYISLGKVETELKTILLIDTICVYGNPFRSYVVAIIVPSPVHLQELAVKLEIKLPLDDLYDNPIIVKAVLDEISIQGQRCGLEKYEIPRAIKLAKDVWTPESGLVTSTLKLRRKEIEIKYQEDIKRLYTSQVRSFSD